MAARWATRTLGASTTSLAAMRALTGVALLYESIVSIDPWTAYCFLTEHGVNPRRHTALYADQRVFSLHLAHPSAAWTAAIHAAMVASALLLVCGWWTRVASTVGYITFTSTINRAWMLGHAFDLLLFAMLLWGALGLPWADAWSVDSALSLPTETPPGGGERSAQESSANDSSSGGGAVPGSTPRAPPAPRRRVVLSLATAGMYAQVAALYSLSAWHKSDEAWAAGTAPLLAMDSDFIARPLARTLRRSPTAARFIVRSGPWVTRLEACAPLLLALPWEWPRALGVVALLGFHVGLAVCLRLNDITIINVASLAMFVPDGSWRRIARAWPRVAAAVWRAPQCVAVHLIDGGWATRRRAPSGPRHGQGRTRNGEREEGGGRQSSSGCAVANVAQIASYCLTATRCIVFVHLPLVVVLGKRAPESALAAVPGWFTDLGRAARIDQSWNVFSPRPPAQDWWLAFPAQLKGGYVVDAFPVTRRADVGPPFTALPHRMRLAMAPRGEGRAMYDAGAGSLAPLDAAAGSPSLSGTPAWCAWCSGPGVETNTFASQCADPSIGPGWEGEHCAPAFNLSSGALFRAPVMADPVDGPPRGFSTDVLYNERWCKYFENLIRGACALSVTVIFRANPSRHSMVHLTGSPNISSPRSLDLH